MDNKFSKNISKYWTKLNNEKLFMCPSITMFRIITQNKIIVKNKNILDIGFGEGQNILELQKRKAKVSGIELRSNKIKQLSRKHNISEKNLFKCDLNKSFPEINNVFSFIYSLDTINYIEYNKLFEFFDSIFGILKKDGYFLIQYPQAQLKQKSNTTHLNFLIDFKKYKKRENFYPKINPVIFLSDLQINNLIKSIKKKFKLISSTFDIGTFSKSDSSSLTINRFLLFKRL